VSPSTSLGVMATRKMPSETDNDFADSPTRICSWRNHQICGDRPYSSLLLTESPDMFRSAYSGLFLAESLGIWRQTHSGLF
jgi:hypothetical protein